MASTTVTWIPGTSVYFGTHRFIITTDGSTEWVRPTTPSSFSSVPDFIHVALYEPRSEELALDRAEVERRLNEFLGPRPSRNDLACATFALANVTTQLAGGGALAPSTELGDASPAFPLGLQIAAQNFERLMLDAIAPPDDEFVGMLDYDHESLHNVLTEGLGDSSSDSESHHLSRECFMASTPEGRAQSMSNRDDPSDTPRTESAAANPPRQHQPQPTPEQLRARQEEVTEAKRQLEQELRALRRELARRPDGGRARARAGDVHHQIVADNARVPDLPRASQNVAAAAAVFQNVPEPDTPEGRHAHQQVRQFLERAARQHADSASQTRDTPAQRASRTPTRGSVQSRLGNNSDVRPTLDARHRERKAEEEATRRGRHPRRGGRYDDDQDRSVSPDAPGPRVFTSRIRRAPFPARYRPPSNIPKYTGETDPALWLEDYRLASRAGGADSDPFTIRNLPLFLADSARNWLEHLPADRIDSWTDLREKFVVNFQGTYVRPGNPWDLRRCRQEPEETLRDFIRRFSKQCNDLPNISDADVIGAFIQGTTSRALVHKLGRKSPRTTKELLDIATAHASGEEAVGATFPKPSEGKGKEKREEEGRRGSSSQPNKKKQKNRRQQGGGEMVAAADRKGGKIPATAGAGETPDFFEKKWNGPCPNHTFPVKHLYKDCSLMRKFMSPGKGSQKKATGAADPENGNDADGGFPETDGCLMIFPDPEARGSKRSTKVERREVFSAEPATPSYLKWSEAPITFDRSDHPSRVHRPGKLPLVVNPIVGTKRLSKVLMDGGSGLNILYAETLDAMGINRSRIRPTGAPFHGVVPGQRAVPLGQIDLPVTFGSPTNFRKEILTFEVVGFHGAYHAILGRPCYAKFMAIPNYTYLKLKMPGPKGVITVGAPVQHAYQCEMECGDVAAAIAASTHELAVLQARLPEQAPEGGAARPQWRRDQGGKDRNGPDS